MAAQAFDMSIEESEAGGSEIPLSLSQRLKSASGGPRRDGPGNVTLSQGQWKQDRLVLYAAGILWAPVSAIAWSDKQSKLMMSLSR